MPYNQFSPMYSQYIPSGTNDIQGVRWVSSFDEVRAASVPYGRNIFMNSNEDIFYIKDSNGNVSCFKFEKIATPVPENFVTREEFDQLRSKYEQLVQQQQQPANANQSQPIADNAANAELSGNAGTGQAGVLSNGAVNGIEYRTDQQYVGTN